MIKRKRSDLLNPRMTSYVVVLCVAMATGLSYCDRVNLSVAVVFIAQELEWTSAQKARVLGSFFWGYLLSQTLGATLAQKYGGKLVLGVAACFWSLLTCLVPVLARSSVNSLVAGRVLLGLFEGVTFPAAFYLLRQFVDESARSRAIALVSIGTLSGAVLSFVICPFLIERLGWDSVFYWFGGVMGPVFVLCWFYFVPETPVFVDDGHFLSVSARGGSGIITDAEEADEAEEEQEKNDNKPVSYLAMIQQREVFAICFAHFTHNLCHFALMSWLPSFLSDSLGFQGDSLAISSLPWVVMGASVGLSSLMADKIIANGAYASAVVRRAFTVGSFVCAGTSLITLSQVSNRWLSLVLLTLAMAANGASSAAGYEASKLDLTKTPTAASRLQSLSNTIATLGGVFGVPLVSALKGEEEDWSGVFLGLGVAFYFAALVFYVLGRWTLATL
ncbi:hypothetical protein BASA81_001712 [Batrachochytrium salamandrivorans]|nr:hypothetical protein BASA81_001712 [Batrachochytrium salamandrivorans]